MKLEELIKVVDRLRGPDGCPWDKEQTRKSLKPYLVEELYELLDAIDDGRPEEIKEELGDLLFQVVLHSRLAKEDGLFGMDEVVEGIVSKMVRRHPHVFGDKDLPTSEDVTEWWNRHKKEEGKRKSLIGGVPRTLPALIRAQQLQQKASRAGFDWESIDDVIGKLEEEIDEFKSAIKQKNYRDIEDELGDIFFVMVRISNAVNVNPEDALGRTIGKFISRFSHIEKRADEQGRELSDMTLQEMEELWNEAKENLDQ